jgi:hypothetical protein
MAEWCGAALCRIVERLNRVYTAVRDMTATMIGLAEQVEQVESAK